MTKTNIEWVSLGDLMDEGTIQTTIGFPFGGHNEDGNGVPHIRPFNIRTNGDIYLNQIKYIPAAATSGKPQLGLRDIVFNNTNTKELVGKCALWLNDLQPVFSNHMTRIRVSEALLDPAYLNFAILHHWLTGKSEMLARSHVAQASIIGARFREIKIPHRPLTEQRIISALIEQVRASSRSEMTQLEHAQVLKQAAMRELFTRGLRGEAQKETEIGLIPKSWGITPLSEIARLERGRFMHRPRNEPRFYGGKTPFIQTGDVVHSAGYIRKYSQTLNEQGMAISHVFNAGTILITIAANIGYSGVLEFDAACPDSLVAISPSERLNNLYLNYYLQTQQPKMDQEAPKGTQKNINIQFLSPWPVPVPTLDEQREIVFILDALDRKIALHRQKRTVLEELFQALLHKLMTGEIRVSELDLSALSKEAAI